MTACNAQRRNKVTLAVLRPCRGSAPMVIWKGQGGQRVAQWVEPKLFAKGERAYLARLRQRMRCLVNEMAQLTSEGGPVDLRHLVSFSFDRSAKLRNTVELA